MRIRDLQDQAHAMAVEKGWYTDDEGRNVVRALPELIALAHSELSEALEAFRDPNHEPLESYARDDGKPEGVGAELADCVIRIADACGHLGIDLERHIKWKLEFNRTRPRRHGGKRC